MQAGSAMRSHDMKSMIAGATVFPAPIGLFSGAPPMPGKRRPTGGDSLPEGVLVPTVGAEMTADVVEDPKAVVGNAGEMAGDIAMPLDPTCGANTAEPGPRF